MPKKQEKHPNLWSGSDPGSFPGAGPKPNAVRRMALNGAMSGTKYAALVADGRKVVPILNPKGDVTGYRFPTLRELEWAIEYCAKIGVPTRSEVKIDADALKVAVIDVMKELGHQKEAIAAVVKGVVKKLAEEAG